MGTVEQLFIAPESGEPMVEQRSVDVIEGGLVGDRYLHGAGYYSPYDVCEVTLLEAEAIETIHDEFEIALRDGRHRRNVVTRGVDLHDLIESTVRIGTAELRGTRPRPPCAHVEEVAGEDDVARALGDGRGGICAQVVEPGTVTVGDSIEVVNDDPRTVGETIAKRLGSVDDQSE